MAAATIVTQLNEFAHIPALEAVTLTVSDGETYVSKKFALILGALATSNADNDGEVNVTFSGQTATINFDGATDLAVTLLLWGRQ